MILGLRLGRGREDIDVRHWIVSDYCCMAVLVAAFDYMAELVQILRRENYYRLPQFLLEKFRFLSLLRDQYTMLILQRVNFLFLSIALNLNFS